MQTAHDWASAHRGPQVACANCGHVFRYQIQCKDRFCEPCSKNRKARIIDAIEPTIKIMKEPHFLTLTVRRCKVTKPNIKALRHSFTLLRRRDIWLNVFKGFYNIELGTIDDKMTCNMHIHVVYDGFDIYQPWLSWVWSQVADGYVVHIERCESSQKIMHYITKHFCKVPYTSITGPQKENLNEVLKGIRLIQGFGQSRFIRKPKREAKCPNCGAEKGYLVNEYDPLFYDVLGMIDQGLIPELA